MQSARMVWAEGEPREVGRDMRSGGITGIHPTREGYLYISANTAHFWAALCMSRRSEEHTSELQSQSNLVCRLLLEKKKKHNNSASSVPRRQKSEECAELGSLVTQYL